MPRPERYQLAFDFHAAAEPSPSPCQASSTGLYQDLAGLGAREEHLGRFVRVAKEANESALKEDFCIFSATVHQNR